MYWATQLKSECSPLQKPVNITTFQQEKFLFKKTYRIAFDMFVF